MAAYGVPEPDIARVVAIDPKTLRKHYRDELDTGHVKATVRVAEFLFHKPAMRHRRHLLDEDPRRLAGNTAVPRGRGQRRHDTTD